MRKFLVCAIFLPFLITSCTTFTHRSGDNSNIDNDSRYCQATANSVAPTYICQNPLILLEHWLEETPMSLNLQRMILV